MNRRLAILSLPLLFLTVLIYVVIHARAQGSEQVFLPFVAKPASPITPTVEFRGLWVTRFDWTSYGQAADPAKIDEIVQNAATAGFNAIFFQVRGTADAYYTPGLEPWAERVSGVALGQAPDPLWDPLAYFVEKAHAQNMQLHAYINVYPVWSDCDTPPDAGVTPKHLYHLLDQEHGNTNGKLNGLQWYSNGDVACDAYQRATPASTFTDDHIISVAADLVNRYDIDGIHLDHIRYGGSDTSCDPVSAARAGVACFGDPPAGYASYADWQRAQVNGTVSKFYDQIVPLKEGLWLSAAVWPVYIDYWGWGALESYYDYYQDTKAWLAGGDIDAVSPMIYPGSYNCPDDSFWTQSRWQTLVTDFQANRNGRYIIPGIGAGYCTFDEIEARIEMARDAGVAGHALFSYSGLLANDYFDDLANGPYAVTAVPPTLTWHP